MLCMFEVSYTRFSVLKPWGAVKNVLWRFDICLNNAPVCCLNNAPGYCLNNAPGYCLNNAPGYCLNNALADV